MTTRQAEEFAKMVQIEGQKGMTTSDLTVSSSTGNSLPWEGGGWINISIDEGDQVMKDENTNKWSFNALHESFIEFDDIDMELDGKNPMALVTYGDTERYVVVSEWLLKKAVLLNIDCLAVEKHIVGENFVVYKIEGNFKEWIKWAKEIKSASFPKNRRKHNTVEVSLPKI